MTRLLPCPVLESPFPPPDLSRRRSPTLHEPGPDGGCGGGPWGRVGPPWDDNPSTLFLPWGHPPPCKRSSDPSSFSDSSTGPGRPSVWGSTDVLRPLCPVTRIPRRRLGSESGSREGDLSSPAPGPYPGPVRTEKRSDIGSVSTPWSTCRGSHPVQEV